MANIGEVNFSIKGKDLETIVDNILEKRIKHSEDWKNLYIAFNDLAWCFVFKTQNPDETTPDSADYVFEWRWHSPYYILDMIADELPSGYSIDFNTYMENSHFSRGRIKDWKVIEYEYSTMEDYYAKEYIKENYNGWNKRKIKKYTKIAFSNEWPLSKHELDFKKRNFNWVKISNRRLRHEYEKERMWNSNKLYPTSDIPF